MARKRSKSLIVASLVVCTAAYAQEPIFDEPHRITPRPQPAWMLEHKASEALEEGDLAYAEQLQSRALQEIEKANGDHARMIVGLARMVMIMVKRDRLPDGEQYLARALKLSQDQSPQSEQGRVAGSWLTRAVIALASEYDSQGSNAEARRLFDLALNRSRQQGEPLTRAWCCQELARLCASDTGQSRSRALYAEARRLRKEAFEKKYGPLASLSSPASRTTSDRIEIYGLEKLKSATPAGFIQRISAALNRISVNLQKRLAEAGCAVVIVPTMSDLDPAHAYSRPRGYQPGSTGDHAGAFFQGETGYVLIAQKRKALKHNNEFIDFPKPEEAILHELGHALDYYLGLFSNSAQFRSAYARDTGRLDATEKQRLRYLLQSGDAGRKETFAEAFACLHLGHRTQLEHLLPEVFFLVRAKVKELSQV